MEFTELNLFPDLQRGLEEAGYVTCMPVQEKVFEHSFSGDDIYAQSQTGTGKTAAFLISIFQRIMTVPEVRDRKVLILAPTRELAVQIEGEAKKLGKHLPISSGAFYGGVAYGPQVDLLRDNVQVIIGTPGRIIDFVNQGKMLLKDVGFLVIDEADRMFDMGFIDDLRKLIRYLPPAGNRQTYLFSATLGLRVKDLAWEYMHEPHEIAIEPEHVTVDLVTQELYHVGSHEKMRLLLGVLDREKPKSCIVFCNQKFMVEEVARRLKINGFDCEYLMGDLPQSQRLRIIERLKAGELSLLVATDVAARGLDVEALDLVVNYDVPDEVESYVHRIGRTARAGKAGKAVTLACEKFVFGIPSIEKYLGQKIPVAPFDTALLLEDRSEGMRFGRTYGGPGDRGGRGGDRGRSGGYGDRGRSGGRAPSGGGYGHREGPRREDTRREGPRREGAYAEGGRDTRSEERRDGERPENRENRSHFEDRGIRSGERRPADRRPSDRRSGERRDDTRRDEARREGQGEGRGQRSAQRPGSQARPGAPAGRDPYALSSEERMKSYKDKYANGDRGQGGKPAEGGSERGGQGGRKAQRPDIRRGAAQPPREAARKPAPHGSDRAPHQKGSPAAAQASGLKKPGLVERLKGLFRGKGREE